MWPYFDLCLNIYAISHISYQLSVFNYLCPAMVSERMAAIGMKRESCETQEQFPLL